jgi:MFS family permease
MFRGVSGHHWLMIVVASCGYIFACMVQRIATLATRASLDELVVGGAESVRLSTGFLANPMLLGWIVGGLVFGVLSDRWGRVKTAITTLIIYSCFTALTGFASGGLSFAILQFLAGTGVGGMLVAAVTLLAESTPDGMRPLALGLLVALSAIGSIIGSAISLVIPPHATSFVDLPGWRVLFWGGALPPFLVLPLFFVLKEPTVWKRAVCESKVREEVGSYVALFASPRWRRNALAGLLLGFAGMLGLATVGQLRPQLIHYTLRGESQEVLSSAIIWGTFAHDIAACLGMLGFALATSLFRRRSVFFAALILAWGTTTYVFWNLDTTTDAYWMSALLGLAQFPVFAGYAIYFPELFPAQLRGTGVGFCYSAARLASAVIAPSLVFHVSLNAAMLTQGAVDPVRTSGVAMSSVFLLGLIALIWSPETSGKPLA